MRQEMRIKIEPKEFFMYSVFLAFNQVQPDQEDDAIRAYLDEHELIPKTQGIDVIDGQEFDVMVFGGCYLDKHLEVIEDIQRQTVVRERLTAEIEHILEEATESRTRRALDQMPETQLEAIITHLVEEFDQDASFGADEAGYLTVTLEPAVIQRRFLELAQ